MTQLRPFHETIVDALVDPALGRQGLGVLANLIRMTKIPANHDMILAALNGIFDRLGLVDGMNTSSSILAQK